MSGYARIAALRLWSQECQEPTVISYDGLSLFRLAVQLLSAPRNSAAMGVQGQQALEQGFRPAQLGNIEAFAEPAMDRRKEITCFCLSSPLTQHLGQITGGS